MELILLGIYSYIVYLIFFKFKWLPWNFVSQVIVVTIPIVGLTLLILLLNIVAPSSADVAFWAPRIVRTGDITLAVDLAASAEYLARAQTRFP